MEPAGKLIGDMEYYSSVVLIGITFILPFVIGVVLGWLLLKKQHCCLYSIILVCLFITVLIIAPSKSGVHKKIHDVYPSLQLWGFFALILFGGFAAALVNYFKSDPPPPDDDTT